jgi:hypothetical protein
VPYEEYDPNKNWVAENFIGRETGLGRGAAGWVGNQEYHRRQAQAAGSATSPGARGARGSSAPSEPTFVFVDEWFERIPRWFVAPLAVVGGGVGYALGVQAGWVPWLAIAVGAVGGMLVIPVVLVAVKLVLLALVLGLLAAAGYLVFLVVSRL